MSDYPDLEATLEGEKPTPVPHPVSWWRWLLFPWYMLKVLCLMAKYPQVREAVKHLDRDR